ncbi:D-glycerate 2-kinase [Nymphon striatum]|nr:D-glycerate 2-kinase [Nymphon striatum]
MFPPRADNISMLYTNIKTVQSLWWSGVEALAKLQAIWRSVLRNSFDKPITTIIATKYNHTSDALNALPQCTIYESAHPIPDENSLIAGTAILDAVKSMPANSNLLLLVSGGASSLVEVLQDGINLDMLIQKNSEFMAQGLSIGEINAQRKKMSRIKAGQLLEAFTGQEAQIIAISDVEGDQHRYYWLWYRCL